MLKDTYTDLKCDDHQKMFNQEVQADRFCSKCNLIICNNCVIDYHSEHLQLAKFRIDKYLSEQKIEIDNLKERVTEAMKDAESKNLKAQGEMQENLIKNIFQKRISNLELIKIKVEELITEERNLSGLAAESLKSGLNNEVLNKINQKNYELEDCKFIV